MSGLFSELQFRGLVSDATPHFQRHVTEGPRTVYAGFDPTAPSLQVGNLMPLILLRHFQLRGHKPIVLMGGGTGMFGAPDGQQSSRPLLSMDMHRQNLHSQRYH